jgi:hypothetical protein
MKGVTLENPTDSSPSPRRADFERRREVEEFVSQLDAAFIKHLVEVGAFSFEASDPDAEVHEELQWLLRKLGLVDSERDR